MNRRCIQSANKIVRRGVMLLVMLACSFASGESEPSRAARLDFVDGDWQTSAQLLKRGKWGLENLTLTDPPPGLMGVKATKCLRTAFPAGSASPTVHRSSGAPLGGAQFYATFGREPSDHLHLRYFVRFDKDFDFVKGGKLPGLFGGTEQSGKRIPDGTNGFSTRLMWRKGGEGEVYAYLPTSNGQGTSLGRGSWKFVPGMWHCIEQEVTLNTPGKSDGKITVWLDGKSVLESKQLEFRTVGSLKIEGVFFSSFFGGDDTSWATPRATHIDFAAFRLDDKYVGPEQGQP